MNQSNSQAEKPQKEPRYDPELLKKGLRCDLGQYEMLKRCSDKKDMTKWNEWREEHPEENVELNGQDFSSWYLVGIRFNSQVASDRGSKVHLRRTTLYGADLRQAKLHHAYLEGAKFNLAKLQGSDFHDAHLQGAILYQSHIEGASFRTVVVDSETSFWQARVDKGQYLKALRSIPFALTQRQSSFWNTTSGG